MVAHWKPAGHIELRKRKQALNANAGKRAPLKVVDPLDKKKPIPRWLIWTFLLLLGGGCKGSFARLNSNACPISTRC